MLTGHQRILPIAQEFVETRDVQLPDSVLPGARERAWAAMRGQAHRRIGRYGHAAGAAANDAVLIDRNVDLRPDSQCPRRATELRKPVIGVFHAAVQAIGHRPSLARASDSVHVLLARHDRPPVRQSVALRPRLGPASRQHAGREPGPHPAGPSCGYRSSPLASRWSTATEPSTEAGSWAGENAARSETPGSTLLGCARSRPIVAPGGGAHQPAALPCPSSVLRIRRDRQAVAVRSS